MKRFTFFLLLAFFGLQLQAQNMEEAIEQTFAQTQNDTSVMNLTAAANRMELIANKWPDQWAPHYYAAYAQTQVAVFEPDPEKKDAWLDMAEEHLNKMENMTHEHADDWHVLKANLAGVRMIVDPENRWMQYGPIHDEQLKKALELNPENPRAYYLQGTSLFYTPAQFGGGPDKALPYFEKAAPIFEAESDEDILDPYWGEGANYYYLQECKKAMGN